MCTSGSVDDTGKGPAGETDSDGVIREVIMEGSRTGMLAESARPSPLRRAPHRRLQLRSVGVSAGDKGETAVGIL